MIEHLKDLDLPGGEAGAGQALKGVDLRPTDGERPETGGAATARQAPECRPEIEPLRRQLRNGEIFLDLAPPLCGARPREQSLKMLALGNAFLVANIEAEGRLREGRQALAEVRVKLCSETRKSRHCA